MCNGRNASEYFARIMAVPITTTKSKALTHNPSRLRECYTLNSTHLIVAAVSIPRGALNRVPWPRSGCRCCGHQRDVDSGGRG